MKNKSLAEIQQELLNGKLTMLELTQYYLNNIETHKTTNAYIEVFREEILNQSKALDFQIKNAPDSLGALFGCVISIKDLICYKDHKVEAASKILKGFESLYTASALQNIINEGALVIGRTNCDEFGMGSANINSSYGAVRNGLNLNKIAGGSSGGAAVAAQTDTCLVALGTDTGGSVRQPAALCGIYGFKPGYGAISRYGLVAYASSFDQLGLLAKNVENIDALMPFVCNPDEYDATMNQTNEYSNTSIKDLDELKLAVLKEALEAKELDEKIKNQTYQFIHRQKEVVKIVDEIHFSYLDYLVACYYILTTAEASSNLSRYDGVKYGYRAEGVKNIQELYVKSRSEGFGAEAKKRILLGSFVLSEAKYDVYYTKAQKVRGMIKKEMDILFENYDFVVLPTTTRTAWAVDEKPADPMEMYFSDIYTVIANLCGATAISIPLGEDEDGMPYGVQIMAKQGQEKKLLTFVKQIKVS